MIYDMTRLKLYVGLCALSSALLIGMSAAPARADTYTLNYDGYSEYSYYTSIEIPPGTYYYQCYTNGGLVQGGLVDPTSVTELSYGWWEMVLGSGYTTGAIDYSTSPGGTDVK